MLPEHPSTDYQTHKQFLPPGCKAAESATLNSRHHLVLHTHTNTLATYIYIYKHIFLILFNLIFPTLETALLVFQTVVTCYMLFAICYMLFLVCYFGICYLCYLLYAVYCVDVGCQVIRISLRCRNLVYATINTLTLSLVLLSG